MKVSKLKKDRQLSIRINSRLKAFLQAKGLSPQKVLDNYLNNNFKLDENLSLKEKR